MEAELSGGHQKMGIPFLERVLLRCVLMKHEQHETHGNKKGSFCF
jgi:hypothetical protein